MERDIEALVDAAALEPPNLNAQGGAAAVDKRRLRLVKIEVHQFGGLHACRSTVGASKNFIFEPTKAITLFEGWNGSGKTSLLNAVIWCLTGQLLRPQRKPEQGNVEFECRIERGTPEAREETTLHKLTPVSPMPDPRYLPDATQDRLAIDTWVELTFIDQNGCVLSPMRRTQTRNARGNVIETEPNLGALGVDPIAVRMGTTMPGLVPFIQVGAVSELGQAVTQLTGLVELVDLARHATKVRQRLQGEQTKARLGEIDKQDKAFREARDDLRALIKDYAAIAPDAPLPEPSQSRTVDAELKALDEHFANCKTQALQEARAVLGQSFNPADSAARESLETNIGPAVGQLQQLNQLASAARLSGLGALAEEQLEAAAKLIGEVRAQSVVLAELATTPVLARRKQLYARVSSWMKLHGYDDTSACAVCGGSLEGAIDRETGRPVRDHLQEALDSDTDLIGHTIRDWSDAWRAKFVETLPEVLHAELRKNLPVHPSKLIKQAICIELFDTLPFKGPLSLLKRDVETACDGALETLPPIDEPAAEALPPPVSDMAGDLGMLLTHLDRAIAFARWRNAHREPLKQVYGVIVGSKAGKDGPVDAKAPLRAKLAALDAIVKNAVPMNTALELCKRMARELQVRREKEHRIEAYETAAAALVDVMELGELAQRQVEDLRGVLQDRAVYWRNRFYLNAYSSCGHALVDTTMDSKGTLNILVGSKTAAAPAQHIANSSALRASLMGFFIAFWEHVLNVRGGLELLMLDDPQELLDDDNRERLARSLPEFVDAGAQIVVTTHDRLFARIAVEEARKKGLIEHRSVHPVNDGRSTIETAPAIESLDQKRADFENHTDNAQKAQDYASEARVFIEARLADLFDDAAYPAYCAPTRAPTFSDHLCRLRRLASAPPNELFRNPLVVAFCKDPAFADGAPCLALLNKAHHNKAAITYNDVHLVRDDLRRLRGAAEDLHGEFRRWRWREPGPEHTAKVIPLRPSRHPVFEVQVHPDLAAFTGPTPAGGSQDTETERFNSAWLDDKAFFYVKNENLGFAAPAGSLVVVECDPKPGNDRNLVIAVRGDSIYARRLLRPHCGGPVSLAAETPDPRKSPPTLVLDPSEVRIYRVLGVLFETLPPPREKQEAVQLDDAPGLARVATAYRVRDHSALPLALPGQLVLGGARITPAELDAYEGKLVALTLTDGAGIFKRVGPKLPGALAPLRQFESIGGLGSSEIVASEAIDGQFPGVPVMAYARQVVGVLYDV
jgi:predicted ATPase